MSINFGKLEEARKLRGHTAKDAVEEIGCSLSLWYEWKNGHVKKPLKIYARAAEEYIKKAGLKVD